MPSYINRTQVCKLIYEAVGVRWNYIDSVKRLKKRGKGRIKRRHATRLKWSLHSELVPDKYYGKYKIKDRETRKLAIQVAQRLGLKYYDRFKPDSWSGYVTIYVPNTMIKPRLPLTDDALRSHFDLLPDTPMLIVADKIQEEGYEAEAIVIRQQIYTSSREQV